LIVADCLALLLAFAVAAVSCRGQKFKSPAFCMLRLAKILARVAKSIYNIGLLQKYTTQ